MNMAYLDLATPSFRLLLREPAIDGTVELSETVSASTGQYIGPAEWDEAMSSVGRLVRTAQRSAPMKVAVLARGRFREARNGDRFVARVHKQYGVESRILSAEEEAEGSFRCAREFLRHEDGRLLVITVGGASVEFAVGVDSATDLVLSVPLGPDRVGNTLASCIPPGSDFAACARSVLGSAFASALRIVSSFETRRVVFVGTGAQTLWESAGPLETTQRFLDLPGLERIASAALERETHEERRVGFSALVVESIARGLSIREAEYCPTEFGGSVLAELLAPGKKS